MRYCEYCAEAIEDDASFCQSCGSKVQRVSGSMDTEQDQGSLDQQNAQQEFTQSDQNTDFNQTTDDGFITNTIPDANYAAGSINQDAYVDNAAPPPNKGTIWLILGAISTCCCSPLNIVTAILGIISVVKYNNGEYTESENLARIAKILFFVFLGLTVVLGIISAITGILGGFYSNTFDGFEGIY